MEYVNKTREYYNLIALREKGSKNVKNIDLENEVESWEYTKDEVAKEDETINISGFVNIVDESDISDVHVKIVPRRNHNDPKILEAKKKEIEKMNEFGALETIEDIGQENIVPTKWVVSVIENDDKGTKEEGFKARLVIRGDLESGVETIRRDSPTILKHTLRLLLHISRQHDWQLRCGDIRSAFLQGMDVEREILVKPPPEAELPDRSLWRLKKSVYGTADGGRLFYLRLKSEAQALGMQILDGDQALFFMIRDGELIGAIGMHFDDLLFSGNALFHTEIMYK